MIVASDLTKHLLSHWKIGMKWFEECLIDWDPASNAMGWQWPVGATGVSCPAVFETRDVFSGSPYAGCRNVSDDMDAYSRCHRRCAERIRMVGPVS